MVWVRKGLVHLLSLILLLSLLGLAFSVSANLAFSHQSKVESWLSQSNFYDNFVSYAANQAKESVSQNVIQVLGPMNDTAIQQAAQSAFTSQLVEQSAKTFINGNYDWLEGNSAKPDFVIDLTQAKQTFADQLVNSVRSHIASLPACTTQQLISLGNVQNIDLLSLTCLPPGLSTQNEAATINKEIVSNNDFLGNPIITANNVNSKGVSVRQPYYIKLAKAPSLYHYMVKLPLIYAVTSIVSAFGILLIAIRKRKGLRRIGFVLIDAGIILVVVKFIADALLNKLDSRLLNNSSIGLLQQSLDKFLHLVEQQLVKVDLWFGIGYLVLGVIILIFLLSTRRLSANDKKQTAVSNDQDSTSSSDTLKQTAPINSLQQPPKPKRPARLIQ